MKFHLKQIPEEGLELAGVEVRDILEVPAGDPIKQVGPVNYELQVGCDDDGVWATGQVDVDVELQCGRCLENFVYPLVIPDVAVQLPTEGHDVIDLTPFIREDILLALPAYPHCDWAGDKVCAAPTQDFVPPIDSAATEEPGKPDSTSPAWGALDRLHLDDRH